MWEVGVAAVPGWRPELPLSLMTCTWLPHTPENKPHPSWELCRCTMMQDRTIWWVMILANGLLLCGLGWWGVVEKLYKWFQLGVGWVVVFSWRDWFLERDSCMILKGSWINCFEKNVVLLLLSAGWNRRWQHFSFQGEMFLFCYFVLFFFLCVGGCKGRGWI
jgi:hypothetical protein